MFITKKKHRAVVGTLYSVIDNLGDENYKLIIENEKLKKAIKPVVKKTAVKKPAKKEVK